MPTVIKTSKLVSWRYGMNTQCQLSLVTVKKDLYIFFLVNATAESVNCSLFSNNLQKHFCYLTYKKNFLKHIENLPQHLSAIIYRLPTSLQEIEINQSSISPRAFLKLSIIVITLVQKSLSCPSL